MADYAGSCHCGAIGFVYATDRRPERWSIRACQCRFCRAHHALSTSDPSGTLRFHCREPDLLQRYRFGLRTADFLVCRNCGVYIGALIRVGEQRYGIINTHALDDPPARMADVEPAHYDAEDSAARIGRREERWTPATG